MTLSKESKYLAAFGKRIAELRRSHGFTQEQLAEKVRVSVLTIAGIEQGRRWARLSTLHKIAKALSVPVDELLKGLKS